MMLECMCNVWRDMGGGVYMIRVGWGGVGRVRVCVSRYGV